MRRSAALWSTALGLSCVLGFVPARGVVSCARADDSRGFSAQEQKDLDAGKLVVRPESRIQGDAHFIGGLSWQVMDADVAHVWAAIADVSSYPRFLPAVTSATRVAQLGATERVLIRHQYSFIDASYCLLMTPDWPAGVLAFHLDHSQPSSIVDAFGELRVTPLGPRRSVVSFAIMVDVGEGLLAGLLRSQVHEWMLRVPEQLKRFLIKQARLQQAGKVVTVSTSPKPSSFEMHERP